MSLWGMVFLGGGLLLVGWVITFLAVLHIIPQSFLLALFAALCIIAGSIISLFGIAGLYRIQRR